MASWGSVYLFFFSEARLWWLSRSFIPTCFVPGAPIIEVVLCPLDPGGMYDINGHLPRFVDDPTPPVRADMLTHQFTEYSIIPVTPTVLDNYSIFLQKQFCRRSIDFSVKS